MKKLYIAMMAALTFLSCAEKEEPVTSLPSDIPERDEEICIKVMSSNLRHKKTDEGVDRWEARKFAWISMLSDNQPDIAGLQEVTTTGQYEDLLVFSEYERYKIMPGDYTGAPTEVTERNGQYDGSVMLMWKKSRFDKVATGHFWLGEKSDEPHDYPFGATDQHCRACVWAKLAHRASGKIVYVFNTHFPFDPDDNPSDFDEYGNRIYNIEPRYQASREIVRIMREVAQEEDAAVFVTGDLNCSLEDNSNRQGYRSLSPLTEYMWSARHNAAWYDGKISFNGFSNKERSESSNIDHIFYRGAVAGDFITVTKDYGVPFVSDHYPVTCTFTF